jgi:hypothetical protein
MKRSPALAPHACHRVYHACQWRYQQRQKWLRFWEEESNHSRQTTELHGSRIFEARRHIDAHCDQCSVISAARTARLPGNLEPPVLFPHFACPVADLGFISFAIRAVFITASGRNSAITDPLLRRERCGVEPRGSCCSKCTRGPAYCPGFDCSFSLKPKHMVKRKARELRSER